MDYKAFHLNRKFVLLKVNEIKLTALMLFGRARLAGSNFRKFHRLKTILMNGALSL